MSEKKFTPGPWQYDEDGFIYGEGNIVSDPHTSPNIDIDEREGNAALIVSAPCLYAALADLTAQARKWAPTIDRSRAEYALAKAVPQS